VAPPCDFGSAQTWAFEPLDDDAFPAIRLARACAQRGGTYPAVYNAANETCVAAFLSGKGGPTGKFRFLDIVDTVAEVVAEHVPGNGDLSVEDVLAADGWAHSRAEERISGQLDERTQGKEAPSWRF
jgi:1-deoxy-D-xylulose-5-phosphate reductoisomerase